MKLLTPKHLLDNPDICDTLIDASWKLNELYSMWSNAERLDSLDNGYWFDVRELLDNIADTVTRN